MDNLKDQLKISINNRYSVVVTKDHNQGVVIQVARLNPSHVKGDDAVLYKGHMPVVLYQRVVSFGTAGKVNGEINYKTDEQMQSEIIDNVLKAKDFANKCSQKEEFVDQVFLKIQNEIS